MRELEGPLRGHDVMDGETEIQRNEELAQERQDQGGGSVLGHGNLPNSLFLMSVLV